MPGWDLRSHDLCRQRRKIQNGEEPSSGCLMIIFYFCFILVLKTRGGRFQLKLERTRRLVRLFDVTPRRWGRSCRSQAEENNMKHPPVCPSRPLILDFRKAYTGSTGLQDGTSGLLLSSQHEEGTEATSARPKSRSSSRDQPGNQLFGLFEMIAGLLKNT